MTAAITINFRNPILTAECIASLLLDNWSPILVWDNSEDDGVNVRALEAQFESDTRISVASCGKNIGFGAAVNHALATLGRRGYDGPVLLINNDACVRVGLHAALEAQLTPRAAPVLAAPRIIQAGCERGWAYYQPWLGHVGFRPIRGSFKYLSGCCLLVNRTKNDAPLFDESFFMYGEDAELSFRFASQGGRLVLLDDAYVTHAGSASSGHASNFYEYHLVRAHWLLAKKLTRNRLLSLALRALRVPSLMLRATVRAIRYRTLTPIRALSAVYRRYPS